MPTFNASYSNLPLFERLKITQRVLSDEKTLLQFANESGNADIQEAISFMLACKRQARRILITGVTIITLAVALSLI